jgi:hypothetical protein
MKARMRLTTSFMAAVLISLLAGCSPWTQQSASQQIERTSTPDSIVSGSVTLEILHAERLDSYQTYYMMNYPPPGEQFIRIETIISGAEDPQAWGRTNLEIGDGEQSFIPYHVRRVLVGENYEYAADEDFKFHYQFFFSVPESLDPKSLSLFIGENKTFAIAQVYRTSGFVVPTASSVRSSGEFSVIAGGSSNSALATHTTVSGGQYNTAAVAYATVGGGRENSASFLYTTIAGGYGNLATGRESSIGGGSRNTTAGDHAAIAGGIRNQANASDTVVAGGAYNHADEVYTAIGGGTRNIANGTAAAVSGGAGNEAVGEYAAISGGLGNHSSGDYSALLGGRQNTASGAYSAVLGGLSNQVEGDFSTALGHGSLVSSDHPGTFLYADSLDLPFSSLNPNEFAIRATGGVRLVSAVDTDGGPSAGVILPAGAGSWEILSSRAAKIHLEAVQTDQILTGLMDLPLYTWSYRTDPTGALHIGPIAEDFHAKFDFGASDSTIATVDADGIALAAIQETGRLLQSQQFQLSEQQQRLDQLEARLKRLQGINVLLQVLNAVLLGLLIILTSSRLKAVFQSPYRKR